LVNRMKTTTYRLSEVLDNYDSLRKPLSEMERAEYQGEYPYYGAQGIIDYVREYRCNGEYLLIAEDGENLKSRNQPIALIAEGKFWVNNHAHVVKTNSLVDIRFMCYFLNHSDINGYITGSAQPKLSQGNLNRIKMSFPEIDYQEKIVSVLYPYDKLIELNNKRIKLFEQAAEEIYKEWFVRFRFPGYENAEFENDIPKGWEYKRLNAILDFSRGLSYTSEQIDVNEGINLINLGNLVGYGGFKKDGIKLYQGKYKRDQIVENHDLIMGVTDMTQDRRTVGSVGLVEEINDNVSIISMDLVILRSSFSNYYLYCLFKFGGVSKCISQFANGTNVLHLKPADAFKVKVLQPVSTLIEQFDTITKPLFLEISKLIKANENLAKQRDCLLPRLMSGKLEV